MFRKCWMLMMALVLAMVMPLNALADKQHTLSILPGEMLGSEEGVVDLLEALDLRLTVGDASGALSVLLNNETLFTLGLTADSTGLYADSTLFNGDVLYITWDDAFAMLTELMIASLAESGADEETLQSLAIAMTDAKKEIINTFARYKAGVFADEYPVTVEESLQQFEIIFPDDPEMLEYADGLYEKLSVEEGYFADAERDSADRRYSISMDGKDLAAVCESQYMKDVLKEALVLEMPDASEAELEKAAEQMAAELKQAYEQGTFGMTMDLYTLDGGQTLVGLDFRMDMLAEPADAYAQVQQTPVQLVGEYNRLTEDGGRTHKASVTMTTDGEEVAYEFDLYRAWDGVSTGFFGMLAGGEEVIVRYSAENTDENTRSRLVELYQRSNALAILRPAASDRPVIAVELLTEPASEAVLYALETATAENSSNLLSLSETAMNELKNQIVMNATQMLYNALAQLPSSTLTLLMSSNVLAN